MIRRPPRSTLDRSSAASDVYKRQVQRLNYCKNHVTDGVCFLPLQVACQSPDHFAFGGVNSEFEIYLSHFVLPVGGPTIARPNLSLVAPNFTKGVPPFWPRLEFVLDIRVCDGFRNLKSNFLTLLYLLLSCRRAGECSPISNCTQYYEGCAPLFGPSWNSFSMSGFETVF